ncbi:S1C family serine protease [Atopomonas sediminilitoris]|uniref:S1C family serine protease n=1 Tax=Atopomonas sediminilitoris TaxID=2919919 RepID=UPI001F4D9882|nr:trypsin-like peptidase domain-containing protein [Atopomonas sediminilitoris]MCJ8169950.1 trypsin-like peptidase domain-containing protein [Atopomonas sediminilitoris]
MKPMLKALAWPIVCGLLTALLLSQYLPQWLGDDEQKVEIRQVNPWPALQSAPTSYAQAVQQAAPAVVNLYTTKLVARSQQSLAPIQELFDHNLSEQKRLESSLGSGVIMSPQGHILTNNHVISGAEQVVVALRDGRETVAKVIGSDPETDLAVLQIELDDLPSMTLGQSDQIRIGDVALAIGNPFGVGQTVTMGIISATGRHQLGLNTYEDFIQTDAAINPGNSGGALVDAYGNLIGINTAIFSKSGGSQGIGFAIPTKLALSVMASIVENGRVIRGWLGIEVQPLTPELAESFDLEQANGVIVAGVYRGSPAAKAGMQPGDVLLAIAGKKVSDGHIAMNQIARSEPGEAVTLTVQRNGAPLDLTITIGVRPQIKRE